jgi:DNA-binding Xre family transcriptional regulator
MIALTPMAARFRLDVLLEQLGMSMSELARRSDVSFVTVNAIAKNRTTQVKLDTLDKLSAALGVEPGDLVERAPKKRGRG